MALDEGDADVLVFKSLGRYTRMMLFSLSVNPLSKFYCEETKTLSIPSERQTHTAVDRTCFYLTVFPLQEPSWSWVHPENMTAIEIHWSSIGWVITSNYLKCVVQSKDERLFNDLGLVISWTTGRARENQGETLSSTLLFESAHLTPCSSESVEHIEWWFGQR